MLTKEKEGSKEPYKSEDPQKDYDKFKQALTAIVKVPKLPITKPSEPKPNSGS